MLTLAVLSIESYVNPLVTPTQNGSNFLVHRDADPALLKRNRLGIPKPAAVSGTSDRTLISLERNQFGIPPNLPRSAGLPTALTSLERNQFGNSA